MGIERDQIVLNQVMCNKCHDVITSEYRHDFVKCSCGNISVDGGNDYLRRVGNVDEYTEKSAYMGADGVVKVVEFDNPKSPRVSDNMRVYLRALMPIVPGIILGQIIVTFVATQDVSIYSRISSITGTLMIAMTLLFVAIRLFRK